MSKITNVKGVFSETERFFYYRLSKILNYSRGLNYCCRNFNSLQRNSSEEQNMSKAVSRQDWEQRAAALQIQGQAFVAGQYQPAISGETHISKVVFGILKKICEIFF